MIEESIERAARALCESGLGTGAWDAITQVQREQFIENARAALSAYFADVPVSEGMQNAGLTTSARYGKSAMTNIYKAMSAKHAEEIQ